jgi:hypothetical protein
MDATERIDAVWCVDSETGQRVLIDRLTNKIITREGEVMAEPRYPVLTEAEIARQEGFRDGRASAEAEAKVEIDGLNEEILDLLQQQESLKNKIFNFVSLGMHAFIVKSESDYE